MATVKSPRKRRRSVKKKATKRRRRVRSTVVKASRRRRRKASPAAPKRRRRRRVAAPAIVAAPRKRRRSKRKHSTRRRRNRTSEAWRGDSAGHAKAARKGHRRRKAARKTTHRRRRKVHAVAAPRRRRHRRAKHGMMAPRRMRASRGDGMSVSELMLATGAAGFGFVLADGIDRFLATYNPAATTRPTDKFTSDGAGTLANTLNVAARPGWQRIAAGVGVVAVPTVGSMYLKNGLAKSAAQGMAIGAGVSAFKTFWNNFLMPMLVGKDTTTPALQKSYIARLYPAEVAATINMKANQSSVSSSGSGALSGAQETGVGSSSDVGPFALSGDSPYADAASALRHGVSGDSPYADAASALRHGVSGDSPYADAAQSFRRQAGMSAPAGHGNSGQPGLSYSPGPPDGPGPGPQARPHESCGCVGDENNPVAFPSFLGEANEESLFDTGSVN